MKHNSPHTSSFLRRFWQGLYTSKELEQWSQQLSNPTVRSEVEKDSDQLWHSIPLLKPTEQQLDSYKQEAQTLLKRIAPANKQRRRRLQPTYLKIAAVWIFGLLCLYPTYQWVSSWSNKQIAQQTIRVENGKKRAVTLPDGSRLNLNAGTTLSYPSHFSKEERRIKLNGEAYMQIARDEDSPFIIETEAATVKILGTSFNLKTYTSDSLFNLCVESGKVQIERPDVTLTLTANQQVSIDCSSGEFIKENQAVERVLTWQQGALYFHRTPLYAIANQIHRLYNVEIELDSSVDSNERITGEHENPDIHAVLNSICLATGLSHRTQEGKILIYKQNTQQRIIK